MNKLVVVDGYTVNPGDHSWDGFRAVADIDEMIGLLDDPALVHGD